MVAILSLSVAIAFADDGDTGGNSSPSDDDNGAHQPQRVGKIPDYSKCSSGSSCAVRAPIDNNNFGGGGNDDNSIHHKLTK